MSGKWFQAAQDIITQHKATREPLEKVSRRLMLSRRLGSHERRLVTEAIFAWARSAWPAWFIEMIQAQYGTRAEALLTSLSSRAKPVLAVDRRYLTTVDAQAALEKLGITTQISTLLEQALIVTRGHVPISKLPANLQRALWVMDDGSQMVASLVDAKPGERVLDMCAGGGGKTRYLLQTGAELFAMDISSSRMKSLQERVKGEKVHTVVADGLAPPFEPASFDWVLLDAPCTGTGTLRRHPDLFGRLQLGDVARYVELQRALLAQAARLIKASGKLIYATCSILAQENTEVVEFAQRELGLRSHHLVQLLPSEQGCDGFFMVTFERAEL